MAKKDATNQRTGNLETVSCRMRSLNSSILSRHKLLNNKKIGSLVHWARKRVARDGN